jgi:hypothetical protein
VGVGERVRRDGPPVQARRQLAGRAGGARVDEDVAEQVHVQRLAGPEWHAEDVLGLAPHRGGHPIDLATQGHRQALAVRAEHRMPGRGGAADQVPQ